MVNKTVLMPQEVETFYVIPTIRRYFAQFLKEQGLKQKDIARILNINSATISQYSSNKRGHHLNFDPETLQEIKKSVPRLVDTISYIKETQRIIHHLRESRCLCKIHKEISPTVPRDCTLEEAGCHVRVGCL